MMEKAMDKKRMMFKVVFLFLFHLGLYLFIVNGYFFLSGYLSVKPMDDVSIVSVSEAKTKAAYQQYKKIDQKIPVVGEEYATLVIPKLNASIPVFYGVEEEQLRKGVGHIPQTAMPGEQNNTVLSGHRDTVFRKLGELDVGDDLSIVTDHSVFTYVIRKIRVVDKNDTTVVVPKPKATLTVTTCYPFQFIGNAPNRYVLIAD